MTTEQTKEIVKKHAGNTSNMVIIGATGAIIGAGVAMAATIALRDEKVKEKMYDLVDKVKEHALDYVEQYVNDLKISASVKPGGLIRSLSTRAQTSTTKEKKQKSKE